MYVDWKQKGIALLSYLWILTLIPLLTNRDDRFIHYHAKQGLLLFLIWIIFIILTYPLTYVPYAGIMIIAITFVALTILNIICIIKVLKGNTWAIPALGFYAEEWQI